MVCDDAVGTHCLPSTCQTYTHRSHYESASLRYFDTQLQHNHHYRHSLMTLNAQAAIGSDGQKILSPSPAKFIWSLKWLKIKVDPLAQLAKQAKSDWSAPPRNFSDPRLDYGAKSFCQTHLGSARPLTSCSLLLSFRLTAIPLYCTCVASSAPFVLAAIVDESDTLFCSFMDGLGRTSLLMLCCQALRRCYCWFAARCLSARRFNPFLDKVANTR